MILSLPTWTRDPSHSASVILVPWRGGGRSLVNGFVGATVVTGTRGKPDVPRSSAQMARFDGEIMDFFSSRSPIEEEEVSFLGWS